MSGYDEEHQLVGVVQTRVLQLLRDAYHRRECLGLQNLPVVDVKPEILENRLF